MRMASPYLQLLTIEHDILTDKPYKWSKTCTLRFKRVLNPLLGIEAHKWKASLGTTHIKIKIPNIDINVIQHVVAPNVC